MKLVPGKKLCTLCHENLQEQCHQHPSSSSSEREGDEPADESCEADAKISALLVSVGDSPIDNRKLGVKRYVENKMQKIEGSVRKRLKLQPPMMELDYNEMMEQLKTRFRDSQKVSDKVQVLTIVPRSCTIKRIQSEFGATYNMARLAKQLVASYVVLSTPNARLGKMLPKLVEEKIIEFYLTDAVSRVTPGKKDCVLMMVNGKKEHVQKRLLLFTLKDAYRQFQDENVGVKVGLTKFRELRPKNVVLPGASGTHNVCVCAIHQNVKLMIEGSGISTIEDFKVLFHVEGEVTYKHLLANLLCNPALPECHLGECQLCGTCSTEQISSCSYCVAGGNSEECSFCGKVPKTKMAIMEVFEGLGVDEVSYKAWMSVERTALETLTKTTEDFVDTLVENLLKLHRHDFIAKQQASFLADTKANLKEGEVVVLGDFAEDYTFVIQDAVQGFHWNNDQATIHPFVAYYYGKNIPSSSATNAAARDGLHFLNFAVISDSLVHDAVAVHCFVRKLIRFLSSVILVQKKYYFSDGAAAQYKNKTFVNLAFHIHDFKIKAEWHFFATSHGKGPCDGVGGTIKWQAA